MVGSSPAADGSWYGKEDTALEAKLTAELPGILLWSIAGWKRLRDRSRLIVPEASKGITQEMEDLASPIAAFLRERCEVKAEAGYDVLVTELYQAWCHWCEGKGYTKPGSEQLFGRNLRATLPHLKIRQPRDGDNRVRLYEGVRIAFPCVPAGVG